MNISDLRLDVEFTSRCNAHCVFCPHPRSPRVQGDMTWETWHAIIHTVRTNPVYRITVAGFGEPTLHPECFSFLAWARTQLPDQWLQLITNGSQLAKLDLKVLREAHLNDIVISFNGWSAQSYERFMGLTFTETLEGLRRLKAVMRDSDTIIKFRGIRFPPDPEASRQKVVDFLSSLGFQASGDDFNPYHNRGGLVFPFEFAGERECLDFRNTLPIGWNGDVAFCISDFFHQRVVGNINKLSLDTIHRLCLEERDSLETRFNICRNCNIPEVYEPTFGAHVG